jgi:hypothetical protein
VLDSDTIAMRNLDHLVAAPPPLAAYFHFGLGSTCPQPGQPGAAASPVPVVTDTTDATGHAMAPHATGLAAGDISTPPAASPPTKRSSVAARPMHGVASASVCAGGILNSGVLVLQPSAERFDAARLLLENEPLLGDEGRWYTCRCEHAHPNTASAPISLSLSFSLSLTSDGHRDVCLSRTRARLSHTRPHALVTGRVAHTREET